jgi:hypothetical protein
MKSLSFLKEIKADCFKRIFIVLILVLINSMKLYSQGAVCTCANEKSFMAPTSCNEYCMLKQSFKIVKGNETAEAIDITIASLQKYYTTFIRPIDFETGGIRIYYGWENNKIVQIICVSSEPNKPDVELGYYVLRNNNDRIIDLNDVITKQKATEFIRAYIENVTIGGDSINTYNPIDTVKFARFYEYKELLQLISDVTTNEITPAFITFEQCYVPLYISQRYRKHPKVYFLFIPSDFNIGHSTIMYLKQLGSGGRPGTPITNDMEYYPYPLDYKSGFLEIGKPCPPRCGAIEWYDIMNLD